MKIYSPTDRQYEHTRYSGERVLNPMKVVSQIAWLLYHCSADDKLPTISYQFPKSMNQQSIDFILKNYTVENKGDGVYKITDIPISMFDDSGPDDGALEYPVRTHTDTLAVLQGE